MTLGVVTISTLSKSMKMSLSGKWWCCYRLPLANNYSYLDI